MRIERTFQLGAHDIRIETSEIARQATGAVLLDLQGTVVLATVVAAWYPKTGQSFFPLTVDYVEKTYAAGRIPHGRDRREGMATEREVLISRLIDRSIRPLFPRGFKNEVHVVIHVMSVNPAFHPDVPALLATAAALRVSGLPFDGPLAAVRMGYADELLLCSPTKAERQHSELDMLIAANRAGIVMVEAQVANLPNAVALMAVHQAQEAMQPAFDAMDALAAEAALPTWEYTPSGCPESLLQKVEELAASPLMAAYQFSAGPARRMALDALEARVLEQLSTGDDAIDRTQAADALAEAERRVVRERILAGDGRIDGRTTQQVRPLEMRTAVLPRAHGSALFTRGETQVLATATLGNEHDGQLIEAIDGTQVDRFLMHYNMRPFATGETGRMGGSKRRELGHGRLAKRALVAVLPDPDEFPYVIRVVSEVTESNGSSSMASVCGDCLAMVDAGVPLKGLAAGIAMGLIVDGERFAVLTDILGDEDHIGDMDLKVAGTDHGITALQMDVKVPGIALKVLEAALAQAQEARQHVLGAMRSALGDQARSLPAHTPGVLTMHISPQLVSEVIGKQGATVRDVSEATGASIEIDKDGTVTIRADSPALAGEAEERIEEIIASAVLVGEAYDATVTEVVEFFGVMLEIKPGQHGRLHTPRMAVGAGAPAQPLNVGQTVRVRIVGRARDGKFETTMLDEDPPPQDMSAPQDTAQTA
jgi:polyribonucleotide nucleotidyltransferase